MSHKGLPEVHGIRYKMQVGPYSRGSLPDCPDALHRFCARIVPCVLGTLRIE